MIPVYNPDGSYNYTASFYGEEPSKGLAMTASAIYCILFLVHFVQAIRYRARFFIAGIIALLMEAGGYALRVMSITNPFSGKYYAFQQILIIVSPVVFAASQYVMLEKIMMQVDNQSLNPSSTVFRVFVKGIAKIFVLCDIASFVLQVFGSASQISGGGDAIDSGRKLLVDGLVLQLISFGVFMLIAIIFSVTASKNMRGNDSWPKMIGAFFASSILVFIRSLYRFIEYIFSNLNLSSNELYAYLFDCAMIAAAATVLTFWHPGKYMLAAKIDAEALATTKTEMELQPVPNPENDYPGPYQAGESRAIANTRNHSRKNSENYESEPYKESHHVACS
ncbi:hypothetical protein HK100_005841, partial [Physocladia obscura]